MVIVVIPSRFNSSRFPGKALVSVAGEPLVARVARAVIRWGVASRVIVATDHQAIVEAAQASGAEVVLDHRPYVCGSDRVASVAQRCNPDDRILNVQGDEAMVDDEALDAALAALEGADLGTVATPLTEPGLLDDPDTVKLLPGDKNKAFDFNRLTGDRRSLVHLGLYAYRGESLARFVAMPPSPREQNERLEQLRALEAGWTIGYRVVRGPRASINRPADLARVESLLRRRDAGNQHELSGRKVSAF